MLADSFRSGALAPKRTILQVEADLQATMGEIATQNITMEAYMKQVLDSLNGMQTKIDEIQESLADTTMAVAASHQRADDLASRLAAIESSPRTEVKQVTPSGVLEGHGADPHPLGPPLPSPSGAAAAHPSASAPGSGSTDLRDPRLHRGDAPGILGNQRSTPVTGTHHLAPGKSSIPTEFYELHVERDGDAGNRGLGSTPKMDFPKFEGENPKVWQQDCETYFELYHIHDTLRTRYGSLNFCGTAAL